MRTIRHRPRDGSCSMAAILIAYASSAGQTEKIARYLAGRFERAGHEVVLWRAGSRGAPPSPARFAGAVVAGPAHAGRHPRALVRFVATNRPALTAIPAAFLSVSLSAAGRSPSDQAAARRLAESLLEKTGWRPRTVLSVAGAVRYSRYGPLKRLLLRAIVRRKGGPTDRDTEFTDWPALDRFAADFLRVLA